MLFFFPLSPFLHLPQRLGQTGFHSVSIKNSSVQIMTIQPDQSIVKWYGLEWLFLGKILTIVD